MDVDRDRFETLVRGVADRLKGELQQDEGAGRYVIRAELPGGRSQKVYLELDEDTVRYSTQCAAWVSDFENPNIFKDLLRRNARLKHGFFALGPEGDVELVETQVLATCDLDELYVSVTNLAMVGDFMEKEFHPGGDVY
ncbi:MAG: hypothetical protein HY722_04970 [Planctomycetes bacterium]|nr:hypothetical protein [Planctomycetota bacterium]